MSHLLPRKENVFQCAECLNSRGEKVIQHTSETRRSFCRLAVGLQKQQPTSHSSAGDQALPFLNSSANLICNSPGAQSWRTQGPVSPICEVSGRVLFMTLYSAECVNLVKKIVAKYHGRVINTNPQRISFALACPGCVILCSNRNAMVDHNTEDKIQSSSERIKIKAVQN